MQITVAEKVGVEHRAGYYDGVGVLRDMFQNHLLQLLYLVAMEPPCLFQRRRTSQREGQGAERDPAVGSDDMVKDTVRGQYNGYLKEPGVSPRSTTATFAALRLEINNWRWQGVPFYLRSGKCLKEQISHIAIQFKQPPAMLFPSSRAHEPNVLMLFLQPDEGIHWRFEAKVPDTDADTRDVDMEFHYADSFPGTALPEPYERLLLDALAGDASLFTRADEVEAAWGLIDPISQYWQTQQYPRPGIYESWTWGTTELLAASPGSPDGRHWIDVTAASARRGTPTCRGSRWRLSPWSACFPMGLGRFGTDVGRLL